MALVCFVLFFLFFFSFQLVHPDVRADQEYQTRNGGKLNKKIRFTKDKIVEDLRHETGDGVSFVNPAIYLFVCFIGERRLSLRFSITHGFFRAFLNNPVLFVGDQNK